jgi:hypothetical protein
MAGQLLDSAGFVLSSSGNVGALLGEG